MVVEKEHFHMTTSTAATISVFLNNEIYRHFNLEIAKLSCVLGIPICPPENALQAVSELTFVMCQKCQNQASLYRPHSNERQSWIKMKTETSKNTSKSVDFSVP